MRRAWLTLLAATGVTLATVIPAAAPASAAALAPAQVRINQVGFPASGPKVAFAMLPRQVASVRFEVVTPYGVAYRGTSADDVGAWNASYRAVYRLSFSGVQLPGQYQVRLLSPARAASPGFIIGDGVQLYRELVDNSVRYFTSERDGPVSGGRGRVPHGDSDPCRAGRGQRNRAATAASPRCRTCRRRGWLGAWCRSSGAGRLLRTAAQPSSAWPGPPGPTSARGRHWRRSSPTPNHAGSTRPRPSSTALARVA